MRDRQAHTDEVEGRKEQMRNTGSGAELGLETPDADAAEQRASVPEEPDTPLDPASSVHTRDSVRDVDEADAAEQERTVALDEDDYR